MKALNNLADAGAFLLGLEAPLVGQRFGLETGAIVDVRNASTGMSHASQWKFRRCVLSYRFDSGFSLAPMLKDPSIALEIARDTATPVPFAGLCRELAADALLGVPDRSRRRGLRHRLRGPRLADARRSRNRGPDHALGAA